VAGVAGDLAGKAAAERNGNSRDAMNLTRRNSSGRKRMFMAGTEDNARSCSSFSSRRFSVGGVFPEGLSGTLRQLCGQTS
jgi:hypothetical protein